MRFIASCSASCTSSSRAGKCRNTSRWRSIFLFFSSAEGKQEAEAAVDGVVNEELTQRIKSLDWPQTEEPYLYKQLFVFRLGEYRMTRPFAHGLSVPHRSVFPIDCKPRKPCKTCVSYPHEDPQLRRRLQHFQWAWIENDLMRNAAGQSRKARAIAGLAPNRIYSPLPSPQRRRRLTTAVSPTARSVRTAIAGESESSSHASRLVFL